MHVSNNSGLGNPILSGALNAFASSAGSVTADKILRNKQRARQDKALAGLGLDFGTVAKAIGAVGGASGGGSWAEFWRVLCDGGGAGRAGG